MKGHFVPLSIPRRMIEDFLYASKHLSLATGEKHMRLGDLPNLRAQASPKPSWCAIFTKALATVISRHPELRQVFVTAPWSRLFQYDQTVAGIVVERTYNDESALLLARIRSPEQMSLAELDLAIRKFKERPLNQISGFRGGVRLARMPRFLRRLFWGLAMRWMPRLRGKLIGGFGVSVTAGMGATGLTLLAPWTLTLHYDIITPDGMFDARITFDHRVVDGIHISAALAEMEQELCGPIRAELIGLQKKNAA